MRKLIFFSSILLQLFAMAMEKDLKDIIIRKKEWTLNPLENISNHEKIEYIEEFLETIKPLLDEINEQSNLIQNLGKINNLKHSLRTRHSQEIHKKMAESALLSYVKNKTLPIKLNKLTISRATLKNLQTLLNLETWDLVSLNIKNDEDFFDWLTECLKLLLLKNRPENSRLELIAFLYINLKKTYKSIKTKEEAQMKWSHNRYQNLFDKNKKIISNLFLKRAKEISRCSIQIKLDKSETINSKRRSARISELQEKICYWLFKAKAVNTKITEQQEYGEIIEILNYNPAVDIKNPFHSLPRIRELSKTQNDTENLTGRFLEGGKLNSDLSVIRRLDHDKEEQKNAEAELISIAEKAIKDQNFELAIVALQKAEEAGYKNSKLYMLRAAIQNQPVSFSNDFLALAKKRHELDESIHTSKHLKRKQKKEKQEELETKNNSEKKKHKRKQKKKELKEIEEPKSD